MYDPVHHTDRKEVWKSIKGPEGKCLWDPEDDDGDQEAPAEATVTSKNSVPGSRQKNSFKHGMSPSPMNRLC